MKKTVLITGTSSGLGRRTADAFVEAGWNVSATLRDPSRWTGATPDHLMVHELDVRDDSSVDAAVGATMDRFGRLDVVVNNAGSGLLSVFEATPHGVIEELFDTNVFGPMRVTRAVLPTLREQGSGRIINVTSSSSVLPTPFQSVYGATKAALRTHSEGLGYELAALGIDVKIVEPGYVPTTDFGAQTRARFAAIDVPEAYRDYLGQVAASFEGPQPDHLASEAEVAQAVLAAATDTTGVSTFRVGGDALEAARRRFLPDAEYDEWRRATFQSA